MLAQECTIKDLMEYNEGVCLPVGEQCVVTQHEEESKVLLSILQV